jgi:hypothetical protein
MTRKDDIKRFGELLSETPLGEPQGDANGIAVPDYSSILTDYYTLSDKVIEACSETNMMLVSITERPDLHGRPILLHFRHMDEPLKDHVAN